MNSIPHRKADTAKAAVSERTLTIDFIFLAVLMIFAAAWAWNEFISKPPYVDPERYPIRGIDISAHNGIVNFNRVAEDGMRFVFIKASEGENFRDENFASNFNSATEAGLKVGVYHFFRFDVDGISQGVNLLRTLDNRKPELGIVIDVEETGNPSGIHPDTIQERLSSMVDILTLKGYRVMFYTNKKGYYDYLKKNFQGYPLWICSFSSTPINTNWTFWQYNHRGRVKGVNGNVDLNTFCGSQSEWVDFLIGEYHPETEDDDEKIQ